MLFQTLATFQQEEEKTNKKPKASTFAQVGIRQYYNIVSVLNQRFETSLRLKSFLTPLEK